MWEEIIRSYSERPRDVQSRPLVKKAPVWFYVYVENDRLYVDCAKAQTPSSNLKTRRLLSADGKVCDLMYDIYRRRKSGEPVSQEATDKTVNQIYWYGVFADMGY